MAEGSSGSAAVPDFDPDTYNPSPYIFEPVGLKLRKPEITTYDDNVVLREPLVHLSVYNRVEAHEYVRGHGGSGQVKKYYEALPAGAKELVQGSGFGEFVQLVGETSNDRVQLTALTERWWDTTNTFHFPFGEATMTPMDFVAITGIRVGGNPIPFDMKLYKDRATLAYFLGRVPEEINDTGTIRFSWFYEQFEKDKDTYTTERDFEQVTRAFVLYLFGATLFPTRTVGSTSTI
ncbi:protein MAIN-LIKE 2-like [Rhododendron vialii]|uniref:protein MAIN-LIKE 2-like n=1 Tax=Rhododendron vialii TaxID=182163 RepID=UPI00265DF726|nr:protein MAIN-LIKE 2-like [Rhododendron vialii]